MRQIMIKTLAMAGLTALARAHGAAKADGRPCQAPRPILYLQQPSLAWGWQPSPGAGPWNDCSDAARQVQLIRYGMHTGSFTPREADRLVDEQRAIERMQRESMADGHLGVAERKRLERPLLKARPDIRAQRFDRPHRPRW